MSRMGDLSIEIGQLLVSGIPPEKIAEMLEIPLHWVFETEE